MSEATDEWLAEDKQLHAAGGFIAGAATAAAIEYLRPDLPEWQKRVIALVPIVVLAVAKEVADHQDPDNHTSDWRDAAATVAGGVLAVEITFHF